MGECVLCHLGDARWMMVDSFRDTRRRPIADAYLARFGKNHRIVAVVATHWDDDHTHGMADVIRRHDPDEVWMPVVLNAREVFRFALAHDSAMEGRAPSGLRDFVNVLHATRGRRKRRWGIVGRQVATQTDTRVKLMAPADELLDQGFAALGIRMEPGFGEVTSVSSNATSIVLWISSGDRHVLLGGDLEAGALGWSAVLASAPQGDARASYIKVPHHGSSDADEPRLWSELGTDTPVNAVTRFTRLVEPLPTDDDVARLTSRAGDLLVAGAMPERLQARDQFDLHLASVSKSGLRPAHGPVGIVRARAAGDAWDVDRFGAVERCIGS